jgi:hypothetical protein
MPCWNKSVILKEGMKKTTGINLLLCACILLAGRGLTAQDTAGYFRFSSPQVLADSMLPALMNAKTADALLRFFPSRDAFVIACDSIKSGQHRQMLIGRHTTAWSRLKRNHKRLLKDMKAQRFSFRAATPDTAYYRISDPGSKPLYAYVYREFTQRKKRFAVRCVAVQLLGHWYLFSDLVLREPE